VLFTQTDRSLCGLFVQVRGVADARGLWWIVGAEGMWSGRGIGAAGR
jgi:hypothetical protein